MIQFMGLLPFTTPRGGKGFIVFNKGNSNFFVTLLDLSYFFTSYCLLNPSYPSDSFLFFFLFGAYEGT